MSTELNALLEAVSNSPESWDCYFILADWYEENGDEMRSRYWRWRGKYHVRAYYDQYDKTFFYRNVGIALPNPKGNYSNLPRELFNRLRWYMPPDHYGHDSRDYRTREKADKALLQAFTKALKKGWSDA